MRLDANWTLALSEPDTATTPAEADASLEFISAIVPGTAAQAMIAADRWSWDDPVPLDDRDVWYRAAIEGKGRHILVFEGLATFAEVFLDDALILASDNMFVGHRVEVELAGPHRLSIRFRAANRILEGRKGRARWRPRMIQPSHLRFARTSALGHMPGFAPPAPPVGPWRLIRLVSCATPHIVASRLSARIIGEVGMIDVAIELSGAPAEAPVAMCEGVSCVLASAGDNRYAGTLLLPKIERWFPHTHGAPRLYEIGLRLGRIDRSLGSTGFRTIDVERGDDGQGFSLRVNGAPIFCRGAVWTQLDPVSLQSDPPALKRSIDLARAAGVNMLRVGATGVYEADDFYSACDEAGILVWQDFMFSNFDYPAADPEFVASIATEAQQFLSRTSGSPALAVLCGGNEVYQQAAMMGVAEANWRSLVSQRDASETYCPDGADGATTTRQCAIIRQAKIDKDTVGGLVEAHVFGCPPGLGSCMDWTTKLDARLAYAVMGIQAFKAVEIGLGKDCAALPGHKVHDPIRFDPARRGTTTLGFVRDTNNAGGTEGGMTNGEPVVVRGTMKPIATLLRGMPSVDLNTKQPEMSSYERSDVCAVSAASVVLENVAAFEVARCFCEKFAGDSLTEMKANYDKFMEYARMLPLEPPAATLA